jgi:hypothetical protein
MKYVTTKIVSRNKEWGTIVNGRLADVPQWKVNHSRIHFTDWNATKIPEEYLRDTKWELLIDA